MTGTFPVSSPTPIAFVPGPRPHDGSGLSTWLVVGLLSVLSIAVPSLIVSSVAPVPPQTVLRPAPKPIAPKTVLPTVDPVDLASVTPEDARAYNAMIPFATGPNPAARPFRLQEDEQNRARAIDCLAAAVLYEAGDDIVGERAVAQVVINRVRHPAFPRTVCGVVFQGAERSTGCQFTFTCDGALIRHRWSDAAWERARAVARLALSGSVFAGVGYATHYHTDWVVPYWSSSLDKITAVGSHLFFRWTGWWGTAPAFNQQSHPEEPIIAALAPMSVAHNPLSGMTVDGVTPMVDVRFDRPAQPIPENPMVFLITIDPGLTPDQWGDFAAFSCGDRPYCKVIGWTDRLHTARHLPLEPFQSAAMAFSYLRDRANGYEKALWNCSVYPRSDAQQCMKVQTPVAAAPGSTSAVVETPPQPARPELIGEAATLLPLEPRDPTRLWPNRRRLNGTLMPPRPTPSPTPGGPTAK